MKSLIGVIKQDISKVLEGGGYSNDITLFLENSSLRGVHSDHKIWCCCAGTLVTINMSYVGSSQLIS